MASFTKGSGTVDSPFGRNEYLRSTNPKPQTESYTLAASTIPSETIDGNPGQKILQPGTVLAKITSGPEIGKVGPFQRGATVNEAQTVGLGAATAGTFTIGFDGEVSGAIAYNATNAAVADALNAMSNVSAGDVTVTGGPLPGTITLTFAGRYAGQNVPQVTVTPTGLTGGVVTVATTTQGGAPAGGATDGRADPANIVGLDDTFLPWQTIERDVEVAAVYACTAVQGWCIELDATGARIVLTNATADAMRGTKGLDILFK